MATLRYDISPAACSGGGHFDVTMTALGKSKTARVSVPEMKEAPSGDELKQAGLVILRGIITQLSGLTHAVALDRLDGLEINISPKP